MSTRLSPASPSAPDGGARIAELERQLAARERTVAALMRRVEEQVAHSAEAFPVLRQNLALERIVAAKTNEVKLQHARLSATLDELRRTQAQLLSSQKLESIGQLAAGIAHEINTPIQYVSDNVGFARNAFTAMLELIELALGEAKPAFVARARELRLDYLRGEVPDALDQSLEGLSRVASIVGAMKEFSHPSACRKEPVDLSEAIKTTASVARNEWKYVAELDFELACDLPPVPCRRDEINQVVLNLIVNAAHAIEAKARAEGLPLVKGLITVGTRLDGEHVEIRVGDTGGGIPPEIRERVFDPFFTTKPVGKGTGQGLAIAYSVIVERHRGSIDFESTAGVGTEFRVRLPLRVADEEAGTCA